MTLNPNLDGQNPLGMVSTLGRAMCCHILAWGRRCRLLHRRAALLKKMDGGNPRFATVLSDFTLLSDFETPCFLTRGFKISQANNPTHHITSRHALFFCNTFPFFSSILYACDTFLVPKYSCALPGSKLLVISTIRGGK